ncbi:expressed unknown protein [Seminavis robusta]|uniref:HMA domain-containing protein n=1 Tax=Seminavis robusta TaxID=568900 RepID=A0A9N8HCT7_9STRA|nr:expressed unknown protein [Seminavis robusta]|eukprot:Sro394_g133950.1 n/a (717) ;mRNA; r:62425-64689
MSRRRGEFEHRTSIFEGAFRAWSHLGGLEPEELESRPAADLDPLTNPIEVDTRVKGAKGKKGEEAARNPDGSKRREYPYEPLPRSGLAHPYVQAILSPWLGPDADNEAIQLGLTTLRTWWQHRRKGESGSAIAALGTEKMKGVVEGYTRHFFTLAHCLIMNDKEQPPRSLHTKMKELDKLRNKRNKKRAREDEDTKLTAMALNGGFGGPGPNNESAQLAAGINADLTDSTLSPLERLHAAQRRQLAESGGIHSTLPGVPGGGGGGGDVSALPPVVNMKGKCVPGKLDLPGIVDTVSHQAAQLSHRGGGFAPNQVGSGGGPSAAPSTQYGDPATTPVVFVSDKGDIQIAMTVDGITCAHCVKIVETVLRGCNGNKSPIDGLLDAAADRVLCSVLIKIDRSSNAKRIAFEAARNLAMVGYTAKAKEMSIVGQGADKKATMDLGALSTAFEVVANNKGEEVFDWRIRCSCPDNGILRDDCQRHSQMNARLFEAFEARAQQVKEYMAGCGSKYGMPCTCGPGCRCANCSGECKQSRAGDGSGQNQQNNQMAQLKMDQQMQNGFNDPYGGMMGGGGGGPPPQISTTNMNNFGGGDPMGNMHGYGGGNNGMNMNGGNGVGELSGLGGAEDEMGMPPSRAEMPMRGGDGRRASRNPSIISFGGVRGMSVSSEATFGRAMSGLSALSIDWENLEDFDVNVDHSAHINNGGAGGAKKEDNGTHQV